MFLDAVHLANQHYKACVRRGNGKEAICYVPCTSIAGDDGGGDLLEFSKLAVVDPPPKTLVAPGEGGA